MCSLLATRNRLREGKGFWWAFSFKGQSGSFECQPQVNKCVIDVGTALVSPREAPSAFFFFFSFRWALWRGESGAICPRSLPLLITEDNTKSRMKRVKETNDIPEGGYALILVFSPASYVSFLPAGVIALPTRREVGIWCWRGGGVQEMSPFVSWFAWMLAQNGR